MFTVSKGYVQSGKPQYLYANDAAVAGVFPLARLQALQQALAQPEFGDEPVPADTVTVAVTYGCRIIASAVSDADPLQIVSLLEQLYAQHALLGFGVLRVRKAAADAAIAALRELFV
jgi:hypothetical protein